MSDANNEASPAMRQAIALMQKGRTVEAEETLLRATQEAVRRQGAGSVVAANAYNELGSLLVHLGQAARAVEAFRQATMGPLPRDKSAQRDRLTFLTNLGQALAANGKFDEAETVFRQGAEARKAFYGETHAGYAFGLEPLAELLLQAGKPEEALGVIDIAGRNFWQNQHPRLATALALRAEIMKAANHPAPPFAGLESLPADQIAEMAGHVLERIADGDQPDPIISRRVLGELLPLVQSRLGMAHETTLNTLSWIANLESVLGEKGDSEARQSAIRQVIAIYETQNRPGDVILGLQGLALAQAEAGQNDDANRTYDDAIARASQLGDGGVRSQVLRNYGLHLAEIGQRDAAVRPLRQSVEDAKVSQDKEMLGRALGALGIFLQHGKELDEAQALLQQSLSLLDTAHPDAVCARRHLGAIQSGDSCGCGDMEAALAQSFRDFVLSQLPADLVERFDVELKDNDFVMEVHLCREPTPEESEHLQRVIHHAHEAFRRRLLASR